ncbi:MULTISPECIES: toll/interleukin-1 receptor domain-containing protein [unclassified Microbulbifer]|uniref:toll/interleukin-1 receptor domain-containing protein n=1 Tax=unclassified Microbulbifer TaxID=2619833 RepID=UPI0027E55B84|nr:MULTISPECIES: toll/interleukin-1 receptor domain-containing protein [unclassified Microbulbifer]
MEKPYHLFVSYASEDEAYVSQLAKSLKYLGLRVWFAPLSLKIGDKLLDSINAGLVASEYGLVVLSSFYIEKSWTKYELDVLHRQHIEQDKRLFPLWHGVEKNQLDAWNPGLSGIVALKSTESAPSISEKIAEVVYQSCPLRGITPSYENPQWRFLQGRGELFANNEDGGTFNLFEAAEFPDKYFPLYIHDRTYTKKQIVLEVAKALYYRSHDELRLSREREARMKALCKEHGYDLEAPGFDPAICC